MILRYVALLCLAAFICWQLMGYAARAAEPRQFIIWDEASDKQFHPHKFTTATACNMDIAGVKDGSGKRLSCRRINAKGE